MKKLKLKVDMSHGPVNHSSDIEFVDIRKYALRFIKRYNAGKAVLQCDTALSGFTEKEAEQVREYIRDTIVGVLTQMGIAG